MKRRLLTLLLALAALPAAAQCVREYRVGISELGYSAFKRDGQWQGVVPELLAELARRSGCRLALVERPRARVLVEFEQGQIDIITSAMQAPERDSVGQFMPFAFAKLDLVYLGSPPPPSLQALRQQPGVKLGTVRGLRLGRLEGIVNEMLAAREAEYSPDFDNLAAKLRAGRLQAAIIPSVIHVKMRREGLLPANATIVDLPEGPPESVGLYVSRANVPAADAQNLQRHVDAMRREGWVQATYARHVGEAEVRRLFRSEAR